MNCREVQEAMVHDFPAFLQDPDTQTHVAACPRCQAALDDAQLVRQALAGIVFPEPDEALIARLSAIAQEAAAKAARPVGLPAGAAIARGSWLRRLRAYLAALRGGWSKDPYGADLHGADLHGADPHGAARPTAAAQRQPSPRAIPSRGQWTVDLLLAGAAVLVVAMLLRPSGLNPPLGHATATPSPSPAAPPAASGTPAAAADLPLTPPPPSPMTPPSASLPAAYPPPADQLSAAADAQWQEAPPAAIGAVTGLTVKDFCVLPDAGLVVFILHRDKVGTREEQLAARDDQRVLQLPLRALRLNAAAVEPRVFADLGDLPGSEEAGLDAIDCAATGGRVLVTRRNQWRMARDTTWTGDLWLLDSTGVRLNKENLLWEADEATADAVLAPDGQAALVLDEGQQTVHILRLDAPPGPDFAADDTYTGVGLTLPSGEPGGIMRWSPDGRTFLLGSIQAEGTDVDVFRWDGQRATRLLHTRAGRLEPAASTPPLAGAAADQPLLPWPGLQGRLDPASLQVTDAGALLWLQWTDDSASAAAPGTAEARVEDAAQIMAWSPDPSSGIFGDTAAATLAQFALPRVDEGRDGERQLSRLLRRADNAWLLAEDDGHVWRMRSEISFQDLAPLLLAGGRLALLPAVDGAANLAFQKPDPMVAADRDTTIPFRATDWLGVLALPRP